MSNAAKRSETKKSNVDKRQSHDGVRHGGHVVERWGWVLLIVVPFAVYATTLGFGITQLDDFIFIFGKDAFNEKLSNLFKAFTVGVFSEKDIYYRPLFLATFVIERALVNIQNPTGALRLYHFTNVVLHMGCVVLAWHLLKRLGVNAKAALVLCLLFAVHPALTMAVAWIPGRNDTLLTLFVLAFFINLLGYLRNYDKRHLIWQGLFFAAAVFTKETAVFVPLVATLFLWSLRVPPFGSRSLWVHATWLPVVPVWFVLRMNVLDKSQDARTIGETITDAFGRLPAYLMYLGKALLPLNLSVFPAIYNEPIWFGLIAIVLIAALLWFSYQTLKTKAEGQRTFRLWLLGVGWFLIFISPFLLVPPNVNDQVFEHRLYLPMIGLLILFGHTSLFNGDWNFKRTAIGSALVGVVFLILMFNYFPLFNSPVKFWENAVKSSPQSSYAHKLLGVRYNEANMGTEALKEFKIAYALNKQEKHARYFIVRAELEPAGKTDEAIQLLREEISINPTYTEAYFELSHLFFEKNNMDSTLKYLNLSKQFQPLDPMINNNLLLTLINLNDYNGAKAQVNYMQQNGLVVDQPTLQKVELIRR